MSVRTTRNTVALVAALALLAPPATAQSASQRASDDVDLAAAAAALESLMDDHLWFGQVTGASYGDEAKTPGNVVGLHGTSDSALWTGVYLAGQAARLEVAAATGDDAGASAALARIREISDGLHRNITISQYWTPATECDAETLPTLPGITTKPSVDGPRESCGVTADGVTTGEPGRLFRACFPEGFPMQAQDPDTRPPMIFGPIPWEDGQGWFCEDGTSRDQYAGVTFGLTAALDAIAGQPELADLAHQIASDLMAMTGYLVRHGWSVVYPHTRVHTGGSENFVFPLFVQVPTARLNMAVTARHAAHVAGTVEEQAFFDAVWHEEWAHFAGAQVGENLLAVQSPHNSYYVFNLAHLTSYDIMRYAPDAATRQLEKGYFAVIDETTRDDVNAHFETLTYEMTGDAWRHDLAVDHLRDWVDYRASADDGVVRSTPSRCGDELTCVPKDEVNWFVDTPSGAQKATQPGSSGELRSLTPLEVQDRVKHHDFLWQRSPYELRESQPAEPRNREPGADFLTPYWMLRRLEQVAPPAITGMPDWAGPHTEKAAPGWTGPNDSGVEVPAPGTGPATHLIGALHEHSSYSDGWFDTRPEDYYRSGRDYGLDFLGGADHSDTLLTPVSVSEACIDDQGLPLVDCVPGDPDQPTDGLDKWAATLRQAESVSDAGFTAIRGFEWTSDRYGHIDVFFSDNQTEAKIDGGYATMETFWEWFTRSPSLGGGSDGIAAFNHPGAKRVDIDGDDVQNWNDLSYVPAADDRMVGIEVFNDGDEFGLRTSATATQGWYAYALDRGWHVGAVGAEDLGHRQDDAYGDDDNNWGGPVWAKTVVISDRNTPEAIRAAMLARRFYAVGPNENALRLDLSVDGRPMGSRVTRPAGSAVLVEAAVNDADVTLELVTNGGQVLATTTDSMLSLSVPVSDAEAWYHLRVIRDGRPVAYSSPVWVNASSADVAGEWLAGDLHVHTCYSHDAYCGPDDDNSTAANPETGEYDFYTLSGNIDERFTEASVRGLDYLAITDHNDVRSSSDPAFGSHGVVGVAGYEASLDGHAQMLGARHLFDRGSGPDGVAAMAAGIRDEGGVFQINHPADSLVTPLQGCDPGDLTELDWSLGLSIVPDVVEVWNIDHALQPPAPAGNSNDDAERFWECFLDAGHRVGATGGSDSHWITLSLAQGVGNPTTWVFAADRSEAAILRALREGRTSVGAVPPAQGGAPLLLEADDDRDGVFESVIGDAVAPGTPMRVRSASPSSSGTVEVRANGETILEATMLAGQTIEFTGPDQGWVRAKLVTLAAPAEAAALCDPLDDTPLDTSYCDNQLLVLGLTSPIYVERVATGLSLSAPSSVHTTDPAPVCALLTAVDGNLAGRQVTINFDGADVTTTTSSDGVACASFHVDGDPTDAAVATAAFAGDGRYAPSSATTSVRITAEPTVLAFPVVPTWQANLLTVTVHLVEHDGVPIVGRQVAVTAGWGSATATTDVNGRATAVVKVIGTGSSVTVTATFDGTTRMEATTSSIVVRR